jgi:hypothetical protein
MKQNEAFPSKYLKKEDVPQPTTYTIATVTSTVLTSEENGDEQKVEMTFAEEGSKPAIVNRSNWATLEDAYGDDSDGWIGKPVEWFVDPSVMFKGKRTGGLRVRVQGQQPTTSFAVKDATAWNEFRAYAIKAGFVEDNDKAGFELQKILREAGMAEFNKASAPFAKSAIQAHFESK